MRIFTPQLFDNKIPSWHEYIERDNTKSLTTEGTQEERDKKKAKREEMQYD